MIWPAPTRLRLTWRADRRLGMQVSKGKPRVARSRATQLRSDDRSAAALADTPKGQDGRPSKSLTLDQAVAVITAARTLPVMELRPGLKDVRRPAELMYAYIVLSLLCGIRTEEARALRWATWTWTATRPPARRCRRTWPCGGRSARTARPRPGGPAAPSASPRQRSRRCAPGRAARPV